jgi:hypothetical protein
MCSDFWVLKRVKDLPDSNIPQSKEETIKEITEKMKKMDITIADLQV